MDRELNFCGAVNEALATAMAIDPGVICFGLGVGDPKNIFGTTAGLKERFGADRVFDTPTSENAMTGIAIGASLLGLRPVMVHQRTDFFLLAMDQLVNNAAKWHYMFGGGQAAGITIRLITGQGWGQGPTHSQNLHAWFAHIPGLKVVMPTNPYDAKGLLLASIFDPNPVVFIEHRWLHGSRGQVPDSPYRIPIGRAKELRTGQDLTIVATSYLTLEAWRAGQFLQQQGISVSVIDLRSIKPLDWETIYQSVQVTGRLLVLDSAHLTVSVAGEIIAQVASNLFASLKQAPVRMTFPDIPSPASPALTRDYYPRAPDIAAKVGEMLGRDVNSGALAEQCKFPHDVPGDWFNGPF